MANRVQFTVRFRRSLVALALTGLALPAAALDLSEAYRLALERDAAYKAAQAETEARREALPQARAQLMPNVSMNLSRSRNSTDRESRTPQGNTVSDSYDYFSSNYGVTLRQPLFRKYNFALYQQAGYDVESAEANLDKSLQDLLVRLAG